MNGVNQSGNKILTTRWRRRYPRRFNGGKGIAVDGRPTAERIQVLQKSAYLPRLEFRITLRCATTEAACIRQLSTLDNRLDTIWVGIGAVRRCARNRARNRARDRYRGRCRYRTRSLTATKVTSCISLSTYDMMHWIGGTRTWLVASENTEKLIVRRLLGRLTGATGGGACGVADGLLKMVVV